MNPSAITNHVRYLVRKHGVWGAIERVLLFFTFKLRYSSNKRRISPRQDLPKVVYVDPEEIRYSTIPRGVFPSRGDEAFVGELGGVWDRCRTDLEDTVLYRSLEERFENGADWEETEMYRLACWAFEHDISVYDSESESELQEYCRSIDALFESIRENGYLACEATVTARDTHGDISADGEVVVDEYVVPDEPRVGCSRHGEYIRLSGGKHRIALARLLGVEEIPVVVLVEHEKYTPRGP